jgi:hypothetical protein
MTKRQKNASPQDSSELVNPNQDTHNSESNTTPSSLSRRSFLGRAGASTAIVAAASVGLPANLLGENAEGQIADHASRSDRSFQIRFNAASRERNVQIPPKPTMATRSAIPISSATFPKDCLTTASAKSTPQRTRPC